jgi:hypothetical protein
VKDFHVPADSASTAEFAIDFPFTNTTAAPLAIRKFNCACSGLHSDILGDKLTCTTENFRHTLRTLDPGKLYEIEAVPVNSAILGLAVLKLETDCPLPRQQLHQAFLVVRKPPVRPAAP